MDRQFMSLFSIDALLPLTSTLYHEASIDGLDRLETADPIGRAMQQRHRPETNRETAAHCGDSSFLTILSDTYFGCPPKHLREVLANIAFLELASQESQVRVSASRLRRRWEGFERSESLTPQSNLNLEACRRMFIPSETCFAC